MPFISDDIVTYLRDQLSVSNIYVGGIPEPNLAAELSAAVRDVPGASSEYVMGGSVSARVAYTIGFVQVNVRGAKDGIVASQALMESIHDLLRFASGITANSNTYDKIVADTEPFLVFTTDTNERPMWTCTYECHLRGAG